MAARARASAVDQPDTAAPDPLAYSIADARRALGGCSTDYIYKLIRSGQLRTVKLGGRRLVPRSELERLLGGDAS